MEKYIFIVFRKKTEQYSHLTCLGGTYQQVQISIQKNKHKNNKKSYKHLKKKISKDIKGKNITK